jgi:hypothetical protein
MKYKPNEIPLFTRWLNTLIALALLTYGGYGVYDNDFALPTRRGNWLHLHDGPAIFHYIAFCCASLVLLSVVLDHYDKRNNEQKYRAFSTWGTRVAWVLFGSSLVWHIVRATHV